MANATATAEQVITTQPESSVAVRSERLVVIDMLRGVAHVLMALIHLAPFARTDFLAVSQGGVMPQLSTLPHILIGLIASVAPTIFFTLVGTSMAFFENSRRKRGWTNGQITRFFLIRALILLILERPLSVFVWGEPLFTFTVLTAIAFAMVVLTLVRLLSLRVVAGLAGILFCVYPLLVERFPYDPSQPLSQITTILVQYHFEEGSAFFVEFSLLGWLPLVLVGYVLGRLLLERKIRITPRLIWLAVALLAATGVLRALGGYGNFTPYQPGMPFIYFFVESKQPPSMVYLLFNMAKALAVLALLQTFATSLQRSPIGGVLMILGRASLFYYVAHLPLYKLIGTIVPPTFLVDAGIVRGLLEWGLGLLILIPICAWYGQMRRKHPDSILQYL
jgi:uncharacterized membrane protein